MRNLLSALSLVAGLAAAPPARAAAAGSVTFLTGEAYRVAAGTGEPAREKLAEHGAIYEGDKLHTSKGARLELTLADQSVLRLDEDSELLVKSASVSGEATKFTGRLGWGKIWAKVNSVLGGQSHFDVETQNAVAGVRGTTFRIDAKHDASALVRVYAGTVAVAGVNTPQTSHHRSGGPRHQVAGPSEVSREEFEKLVAGLMQVKIAADGALSEPERFSAADDASDGWVAFNQQRDSR